MINIKDKKLLKKFGKNVQILRKKAGLTQENLANDADIPLSQIGRIERGEINTTISTAYVLSKALKVDLSDLFRFQNSKS